MFTWVCQRCGKEVDVAEVECPHCSVDRERTVLGSAHGADRGPVDTPYGEKAAGRLPEPSRASRPPIPAPLPPPPHALAIRPLHLMLFALALVVSLVGAIYLARPDLMTVEGVSLPKLPKLPSGEVAPLQQGSIEVAGVRAWRDDKSIVRVKAVLVNHSAGPAKATGYRVSLHNPDAEEGSPAAATFDLQLEETLGARESREVEAELVAPDGLTALPEWNRMRVVIEEAPAATQ